MGDSVRLITEHQKDFQRSVTVTKVEKRQATVLANAT